MSSSLPALEYQSIPHHVFEQLRRNLSCLLVGEVSYLSEQDLKDPRLTLDVNLEKFTLLAAGKVVLLLLAKPGGVTSYLVGLCTELPAIERFLSLPWLVSGLKRNRKALWSKLQQSVAMALSSDSDQALPFAHQGLITLTNQLMLDESDSEPHGVVTSLSSHTILQHVMTRIHRSESLPALITSTLNEVCEWLCLDRLFIYQLVNPPPLPDQSEQTSEEDVIPYVAPHITYEARGHPSVGSVLHHGDTCFSQDVWSEHYCQKSHQGKQYYAVENVISYYQQHPCLVKQLQAANVVSQLIVPLWLDDELWGLLIGHHCIKDETKDEEYATKDVSKFLRCWQPWEGDFLVRIAEHLTIAIRQADLQAQLQYQKLMLKTQVEDRTQNLKDALMAAEAANKTKSEFLATMSHELRTPLTYIIGMSATLLRWSFGDLSPRQRDYLNTIHSSGEQLLDIINDILEVAKIEAGRTVLEINDFSLSNLARSSLESFREAAQAKEVDLRINLRLSEAEDSFRADPRRIRQILANLLSNAVKFTDKGGRISLRVWRDPHNVMFQVEDTGIGIPEAQQAVLFETFKQLESARQRQYPGTGLGLALTKQLVELHNGSIQVVSTPGKGSMFTIRIPIQNPDNLSNTFQRAEPVTGRIILLEDDESSASLICDLLTAANYQVIWVIEGSRIVHQVEILQPVAIILNHHLVSGNSHYIVDDLKRYVATSSIKVISLMDSDDMERGGDLVMEGFDDHLVKPIDPPTLLDKIQMLTTS